VIHSLKQRKVTSGVAAETDFVVFVPGKGIVLIEAKGATLASFENLKWTMQGVKESVKHKDPFDQLERGASNLRNLLNELNIDKDRIPIARLVWFPKMDLLKFTHDKRSGMAFYPYELAFDKNINEVIATIEDCLDQTIKTNKSKSDFKQGDNPLTTEMANHLASVIIGGLEAGQSLAIKAKIRSNALQQSQLEQELLFDLVQDNKQIYFEGPAGSGKSVLLRRAAKNFDKDGRKVLFLTYNLMLEEETAQELQHCDNVDVYSINRLLLEIIDKPSNPHPASPDWFDVELPRKALGVLRDESKSILRYDAIIIDEFQDLSSRPMFLKVVQEIKDSSKKRKPKLVLAGDDYQRLNAGNKGNSSYEVAEYYFGDIFHVTLKTNVRQAPDLVEAIFKFLGRPNPFRRNLLSENNEGVLEVISIAPGKDDEKTRDSELKRLAETVSRLLEDYEPSSIRVLSPYGEHASALVRAFILGDTHSKAVKELKKITKHVSNPNGKIRWRSIMKFKGLESDVVIITDINNKSKKFAEDYLKVSLDDLLYIGMSRARFHVVLLVQDGLYSKPD